MIRLSLENITEKEFLNFLGVSDFPKVGDKVELPCGVSVVCASARGDNFIENPVFHFFLETLNSVSINIISAYIFVKITETKKDANLRVENDKVKINEEAIKEKLSSKLEGDENG